MAKASKQRDPRQMAVEAVQKWHGSLIDGPEAHYSGSVYQVTLDQAFDDVTDALEAEHVADHGPITPDQDAVREMLGRSAGYLIGVQVGLRLRR